VLTLTAADAYLLASAVIRAVHLIAEHRSWLALEVLCDALEDLPGIAASVDLGQLRAALVARDDLARAAGVAPRTIANLERGEHGSRPETIAAPREALGKAGVRFTRRGVELRKG
jgi:hypothetical protein